MTITYEDIRDRVEAGDDAAAIATAITQQGRTVKDIDLGDLLYLLNFRGMLTKLVGNDAARKWDGSVLRMQELVAADPVASSAIAQWLSHITNTRNTVWRTTDPAFSAPFYQLYLAFRDPAKGIFKDGDLDAIYAVGGGRVSATTKEVQALIDDHNSTRADDSLADRITNASALMRERLQPGQSGEEQITIVTQAWKDAV